ncbi:hypothetical protein PCANC_06088 [Puccinia coronata f. sp. avenae]|uniref:Uncharacterized protein n=1 Tax=Puccinia coronata f. sp. avenae TaxID=200324 RepID=A0A2N5SFK3_9BASI|nr:hypothetical protein PCANC_20453 [Puccinia coronata f. sp. avenae]PLW53389.1 hypothetical protein PCANC_06088 [Puccinia coronata f. sp. avenae]
MTNDESGELGSNSEADSSPKVMYSGWDATPNPNDPLRGNSGNIDANLGENAQRPNEPNMEAGQNNMTTSNLADSDAERLPPPLDFPPLESGPEKSPWESAPPEVASTADKPTTTPN